MACCGKQRKTVMSSEINIPMVKAVYNPTNEARHPFHGSTKPLGGRAVDYGYRKKGDVFNVAESDVIARPDLFLAYPCQEKFIIKGSKVVVPCGEEEVKSELAEMSLEDIPGVGPSTADKLVELGLYSAEDVLTKADEDIIEQLPVAARAKVQEWIKENSG